jgi:hypothetical protein
MINKLMMAIFLFIYHSSSPSISPPTTSLPFEGKGKSGVLFFVSLYENLLKKEIKFS